MKRRTWGFAEVQARADLGLHWTGCGGDDEGWSAGK